MKIRYIPNIATPDLYTDEDIIVLRDDCEQLEYFLGLAGQNTGYPTPRSCWKISPNHDDKEILLTLFYIKYLSAARFTDVEVSFSGINCEYLPFMNAWENIVSAVNNNRIPINSNADVLYFKNNIPPFLIETGDYINRISLYIENILLPLFLSGTFPGESISNKTKLWYKKQPTIESAVDRLIKNCPDNLPPIKMLRDHGRLIFNNYLNTNKAPQEVFFNYSCYFGKLAELYFHNNLYMLAVVFVHRSLDLFLLSKVWDAGLITEGSQIFNYTTPTSSNRTQITLLNSENQLLHTGKLVRNTKRSCFFEWLNDSRNLSMIAHGVYSCTENDAKRAIRTSKTIINDIEGNIRWEKYVENIEPLKLDPKSIFDMVSSIDTYCKPVKLI